MASRSVAVVDLEGEGHPMCLGRLLQPNGVESGQLPEQRSEGHADHWYAFRGRARADVEEAASRHAARTSRQGRGRFHSNAGAHIDADVRSPTRHFRFGRPRCSSKVTSSSMEETRSTKTRW